MSLTSKPNPSPRLRTRTDLSQRPQSQRNRRPSQSRGRDSGTSHCRLFRRQYPLYKLHALHNMFYFHELKQQRLSKRDRIGIDDNGPELDHNLRCRSELHKEERCWTRCHRSQRCRRSRCHGPRHRCPCCLGLLPSLRPLFCFKTISMLPHLDDDRIHRPDRYDVAYDLCVAFFALTKSLFHGWRRADRRFGVNAIYRVPALGL